MNLSQLAKLRHNLLLELLSDTPCSKYRVIEAINKSLEAHKEYRHRETSYQRSLRVKHPEIYPDNYARLKYYRQNCPKDFIFTVYIGTSKFLTIKTRAKNVKEAKLCCTFYTSKTTAEMPSPKKLIAHIKEHFKHHKISVKTSYTYTLSQKAFYVGIRT